MTSIHILTRMAPMDDEPQTVCAFLDEVQARSVAADLQAGFAVALGERDAWHEENGSGEPRGLTVDEIRERGTAKRLGQVWTDPRKAVTDDYAARRGSMLAGLIASLPDAGAADALRAGEEVHYAVTAVPLGLPASPA